MAISRILWGENMYKQVFDYSGKPYLVKTDRDGKILADELKKQNLFQYTEIMPPSKFYPPRMFDGKEWHGATVEEYIENNRPPVAVPNEMQLIIANLQMQVIQSEAKVTALENKYDELETIVNDIKGSIE